MLTLPNSYKYYFGPSIHLSHGVYFFNESKRLSNFPCIMVLVSAQPRFQLSFSEVESHVLQTNTLPGIPSENLIMIGGPALLPCPRMASLAQ